MAHLWRGAPQWLTRTAGIAIAACAALPVASRGDDLRPYALVDGSTFQRGCFAPCECPIGQERPLAGTFWLAFRSDNGLFADYDMLDVRWKVSGNAYATPPDAPITGTGTYRIGGEFAIEQRMTADLQIADEPPASFDSGRVFGPSEFPDRIDLEISQNGKTCFDTVLHVVAEAQALPEPAQNLQLLSGLAGALALARARRARG
jgi:hypothetical protein